MAFARFQCVSIFSRYYSSKIAIGPQHGPCVNFMTSFDLEDNDLGQSNLSIIMTTAFQTYSQNFVQIGLLVPEISGKGCTLRPPPLHVRSRPVTASCANILGG